MRYIIDIHIEYKIYKIIGYDEDKKPLYEEAWACGDFFKVNPLYDGTDEHQKPYINVGFYPVRNYELFTTLTNVGNYGNTPYIDNLRGLPADVTEQVKAAADRWGEDGQSHSYFTLKELIDFQNSMPLKCRGMISPKDQKALDKKGERPKMWCQGANAGKLEADGWQWREWTVDNRVLEPLIKALKERAAELVLIPTSIWEANPERAYERADDIRIVFWFN